MNPELYPTARQRGEKKRGNSQQNKDIITEVINRGKCLWGYYLVSRLSLWIDNYQAKNEGPPIIFSKLDVWVDLAVISFKNNNWSGGGLVNPVSWPTLYYAILLLCRMVLCCTSHTGSTPTAAASRLPNSNL